jgi:chemotaxis protein methyltransferase CheR
LIVVELVINALKHAFPDPRGDATVTVAYDRAGPTWQLMVSDNGIGRPQGYASNPGLGTTIINTLAMQLDARVDTIIEPQGTIVTITHGRISVGAVADSGAK